MSRRRPQLTEKGRRHADATSAAMKRQAAVRTCPACGRGNALRKHRDDLGLIVATTCRWCPYERGPVDGSNKDTPNV